MTAHAIPELDRSGLRRFALTTAASVVALFGLFLPWMLGRAVPVWPWALAAALAGLGVLVPSRLRPVYRGWMRFGLLMSKVTTPLIMAAVFFLVVSPIGLLRRLTGLGSFAKGPEKDMTSYRVAAKQPGPSDLNRPY